jgi:hypothetical protein
MFAFVFRCWLARCGLFLRERWDAGSTRGNGGWQAYWNDDGEIEHRRRKSENRNGRLMHCGRGDGSCPER